MHVLSCILRCLGIVRGIDSAWFSLLEMRGVSTTMGCSALALLIHISLSSSSVELYESEVAEPSMRRPSSKAVIENDSDKGLFVLKLKDSAITESINFLKSKGLFPDKIEDSDDEFIFGDDAFDEINAEAAEAAAEEPAAAEEDAGDMDAILDVVCQFISLHLFSIWEGFDSGVV